MKVFNRRSFIKSMTATGLGVSVMGKSALAKERKVVKPATVGIIGLDTSHSPAFTKIINNPDDPETADFNVIAAYPYGSRTLEVSSSRIPGITESVREMGIEIVDSIDELIDKVDFVLLETNDGHPRLEQAIKVMEAGKGLYVDKPVAGSLSDTIAVYEASKKYNVPTFSSSSLRFITSAHEVRHENKIGKVIGVDAYSSAGREPSHPDFFWYGIHGVEIIFAVMGTGCKSVTRTETDTTDIAVGVWDDDRMATFRGIRDGRGGIGGIAYGSEEILTLGPSQGYQPLIYSILDFFRTGIPPVSMEETLEIYAFMEAADESKRQNGAPVALDYVLSEAKKATI
ncbi:MAG: Gfo/Idh/MocA family oxidoreductase [Balneolales bacterium]